MIASQLVLPRLLDIPSLAVSQYKGISYARNYPDARQIYRNISPFGDLQIYSSSYMHFAPGLSDNAAFNLPEVPADAYVGMFIDGDGPEGIMRDLPPSQTAYFRYLPMYYPYVVKPAPDTFVVQFGGGISTMVALRSGSKKRHRGGKQSCGPCRVPRSDCSAISPATFCATRRFKSCRLRAGCTSPERSAPI